VERHCRLYPAIIGNEVISAARVEALPRAGEPVDDNDAEAMATY
jgi:hypothetical protein